MSKTRAEWAADEAVLGARIQELYKKGLSKTVISIRLGINGSKVRKWVRGLDQVSATSQERGGQSCCAS